MSHSIMVVSLFWGKKGLFCAKRNVSCPALVMFSAILGYGTQFGTLFAYLHDPHCSKPCTDTVVLAPRVIMPLAMSQNGHCDQFQSFSVSDIGVTKGIF